MAVIQVHARDMHVPHFETFIFTYSALVVLIFKFIKNPFNTHTVNSFIVLVRVDKFSAIVRAVVMGGSCGVKLFGTPLTIFWFEVFLRIFFRS